MIIFRGFGNFDCLCYLQYEGSYLDAFLTPSQKNYYNTMKKLGNKKPQKTIKRPKVRNLIIFLHLKVGC